MSRFDWRGRGEDWRSEDSRARRPHPGPGEDFGQADYSHDYSYDPDTRSGYRTEGRLHPHQEDYGQADYSQDWSYDRERRRSDRLYPDEPHQMSRERDEPRSWMDRAGSFFAGHGEEGDEDREWRMRRRRGPSDRVMWAVIVERLEEQRGLDLRDVDVHVDNAEVTLNGTVRRKEDKRRIEDVADIAGVRHVQNNLRVRDRGHWTFL